MDWFTFPTKVGKGWSCPQNAKLGGVCNPPRGSHTPSNKKTKPREGAAPPSYLRLKLRGSSSTEEVTTGEEVRADRASGLPMCSNCTQETRPTISGLSNNGGRSAWHTSTRLPVDPPCPQTVLVGKGEQSSFTLDEAWIPCTDEGAVAREKGLDTSCLTSPCIKYKNISHNSRHLEGNWFS